MEFVDNYSDLRSSCLTEGLDEAQVQRLATNAVCRRLQDDEVLVEEGATDDTLYVITSGQVAVTRAVGGAADVTLHILRTGDLAGHMGFVDGRPHSATLRAVGEPTVCMVRRADFEAMVDEDPWLAYTVMKNIVVVGHDILRRMNAQFVEMSNYISHSHGRY